MISHRFTLAVSLPPLPGAEDVSALVDDPPAGCLPHLTGLTCAREAPTLLQAIAPVVAEACHRHNVALDDTGFASLWEWNSDGGRDGEGAARVAQLLLMALTRGETIGYTADDLAEFLLECRRLPPLLPQDEPAGSHEV